MNLCAYGCGNEGLFQLKNQKYCCSESYNQCPQVKKKNSEGGKKAYATGRISATLQYENLPEEVKNNMAWSRGKRFWNDDRITSSISLEELFSYTEKNKPSERKAVLINERGYNCEICGISNWLDKPLTLEMDHIDGDIKNNVKNNLRLLCPNCHSQTPTWKKKNYVNAQPKTDDEFIVALTTTPTIRQALIKLGLTPKGANYIRAKKLMATI